MATWWLLKVDAPILSWKGWGFLEIPGNISLWTIIELECSCSKRRCCFEGQEMRHESETTLQCCVWACCLYWPLPTPYLDIFKITTTSCLYRDIHHLLRYSFGSAETAAGRDRTWSDDSKKVHSDFLQLPSPAQYLECNGIATKSNTAAAECWSCYKLRDVSSCKWGSMEELEDSAKETPRT